MTGRNEGKMEKKNNIMIYFSLNIGRGLGFKPRNVIGVMAHIQNALDG